MSENLLYALPREFPTFDVETLPRIPRGFIDESWGVEQCPSFRNEDLGLALFVDFENPDDREFPDSQRYTLHSTADDGHVVAVILSTDDWNLVEAFVEECETL